MASARMPSAFFELAEHHLPPEQPVGPEGGRPPASHLSVMGVIWFVLASGCRWEDVPPELGCCGMTAHRCLRRWEQMGVWDRLHADLLRLLRQAGKLDPDLVVVDAVILRAFGGGEKTGPSPVDRRKKGKTPHGSGLGKVRWVVERTISWLKGLRRMRVRYDRLGVIQDAWDTLAACVICFRILHDGNLPE